MGCGVLLRNIPLLVLLVVGSVAAFFTFSFLINLYEVKKKVQVVDYDE